MDEDGSPPKRPKYIQNNRKNPQLVDEENNLYHLARQSENAIYWVCSRKKEFRCSGKAVVKRNLTTNDEEVYYTGQHCHDPGQDKPHKSGKVDINSQNKVNKWTALHWAAKRNNFKVAKLLVDNGAKKLIENDKGIVPGQLSTDPKIRELLECDDAVPCKLGEEGPLPFVPNYMTSIGHRVDVSIVESSPRKEVNGYATPFESNLETPEKICYLVKILNTGTDENEYYKIHLLSTSFSFKDFKEKIAAKFKIDVSEIQKVRFESDSKKIVITNDEDFENFPQESSFDVTLAPGSTVSFPSLPTYHPPKPSL